MSVVRTLVTLALCGASSVLSAQSPRTVGSPVWMTGMSTKRASGAPPVRVPVGVPVFPGRAYSDSGAVVAATNGSEITVVRVPLPAAIRWEALMSRRPAEYRVLPGRYMQVLGGTSGRNDVARDSVLVIALRVSRKAPAGRSFGGTVEFSVGTVNSAVPVDLSVPVSRRVELSFSSRSLVASPGKWNSMIVRVKNDGNIDEQPKLKVTPPTGWRANVRSALPTSTLGAWSSVDMTIRLWVPSQTGSGLHLVPLTLVDADGSSKTEQLQVDVLSDEATGAQGALVTASIVGGRTSDMATAMGYALAVGGQLSDSTTIMGRVMYSGASTERSPAGVLLARSGIMSAPPSLELRNPAYQVSAGATSGVMPELGGQFLAGIGGIAGVARGAWQVRAFSLSPMLLTNGLSLRTTNAGRMQGGEVGYLAKGVRTSLFGASLDDPLTYRTLNVLGMRTIVGTPGVQSLQTELGYRSVGDLRGVGISTVFQRSGRSSNLDLRLVHAPGGSRGFARATNEMQVSGSRILGTRGYATVGGWLQSDENAQMGAVRNVGWYATPALNLSRFGSIGIDTRAIRFGTSTGGTRLQNDELAGGGLLTLNALGTSVLMRSMLARVDRSVADSQVPLVTSRQWRVDHSVSALRALPRGTVHANWSYQQFSGAAGLMPSQQTFVLRVDRMRPRLSAPFLLEADVQRMQVGQQGMSFWSARAAATLELPGGMALTFSAERNPFLSVLRNGRQQQLVYTMRLDRTSAMPRLFSATRGRVFRDENSNGIQDRGEAGVAGVVIKCGALRSMTDTKGRYSCNNSSQELDTRSIPTGMVASTGEITSGKPIALRVVQPLRVALSLRSSEGSVLPGEALAQAVVFARDSSGAQWNARPTTAGEFLLDALPVGRYTVGVDVSGIDEPLTANEQIVQIGGDAPGVVQLELKARPMRIRTFTAPKSPLPDAAAPVTRPQTRARVTAPAKRPSSLSRR